MSGGLGVELSAISLVSSGSSRVGGVVSDHSPQMALSSGWSIYWILSCWSPSPFLGWNRVTITAKDFRVIFLVVSLLPD